MSNFRIIDQNKISLRELSESRKQAELVSRDISGSATNTDFPEYGMSGINLLRVSEVGYVDNISEMPRGVYNPRDISNKIVKGVSEPNEHNISDYFWVFGQFIDHVFTLTPDTSETANIIAPNDDEYPGFTIPFKRSVSNSTPRQHPNMMSSFIDASNIYANDIIRSYYLRRLDGSGKLKSEILNGEELLPKNLDGFPNAMGTSSNFFISGDIRVNENVYLIGLHTLFMREHNRLCDRFSSLQSEELIYQQARRYISGLLQHIVFDEFLPVLVGELPRYRGYNETVNPGINTEFSTAIYRLGHSLVSSSLKSFGKPDLVLKDIFFTPEYVDNNGVDCLLKGLAIKKQQKLDNVIVEDLRSFLFGPPENNILHDLASLNIQRGRDHGLPGYNKVREGYGLPPKTISQMTNNVDLRAKLIDIYTTADNIDPWIGALAEDNYKEYPCGELIFTAVREQFIRIRDGDRFWYRNDPLLRDYISEIESTKLSDIINRNSSLKVQKNVFYIE